MRRYDHRVILHRAARARLILLAVTLVGALALSGATANTQPNFGGSYKFGPPFAPSGHIVLYRIYAKNSGAPVQDVVLSDEVPLGAAYVPGSCFYRRPSGSFSPCNPSLDHLWEEDFDTGDVIITRLAMRITAGTMRWPVTNCAYLTWDGHQKEMCFTTIVIHPRIFIPIILR